jgi:hypothetical protein
MNIIFNYRFNNKNRGAINKLLIITKPGKQDEKHTTKPLS